MKRSPTIATKIWFSLSILIIGYLFSTVVGYFLGGRTESSLLKVSEQRFPIAQKAEAAFTKFNNMINLLSEAVLMGDPGRIDLANTQSSEVRRLLIEIDGIASNDPHVHHNIHQALVVFDQFNEHAESVYRCLSNPRCESASTDEMIRKTKELAGLTDHIARRLHLAAEQASDQLRSDLSRIRQISRKQRYANVVIFAGVVICSVMLIAFIITRSIMAPLQRTLMLEKVVEQFADGIAVTNLQGRIEFVNRSWAKMHGYEMAEAIGEHISLFLSTQQDKNQLRALYEKARSEGLSASEVNHRCKDGRLFPTFTAICRIKNEQGRILGIINAAKDITLQKIDEEALRRAKKEAEVANASKSIFLANMSHEIRTPLNGVMGVLNLLLSTPLDHEQLDLVQTGKASADHLLTVISDILDFSKIEAGKLEMEILDFDLRNTIDEVVELPAMQAQTKGLEFAYVIQPEVPSMLQGDPGRLRQIILNLTNNAIKFTAKGEIVLRISLVAETASDARIKFEVIDTGEGIPEDKQHRLFKAFQQTDSSITRRYGGTGLGLSISQKLTELMNGQIGVESKAGRGSTFWFTALLPKQPRRNPDAPVVAASITGKRLLIVDDNQTNLNILAGYLTAWGCTFEMAGSGEMAIPILKADAKASPTFDAVIIDFLMPGMDGAELGRRIKEDSDLKRLKMVVLTSMGMRGEASRMKEIGFNAYLTKPIRKSDLFNCLIEVLNGQTVSASKPLPALVTKHSLAESERQRVRLLVAEDNSINSKLILRMIDKFGFRAEAAANGKEVLKMAEDFHFDLILMDCQMPEMDGYEATRRIRAPSSKVPDRDIPIIAMTANSLKGDREVCIDAGMNDYVSKPINPQELLEAIERNIHRRQTEKIKNCPPATDNK